jgi:ribose 5-phosphate isomerase A
VAVASSERSAALGRQVGLTVRAPEEVDHIDVTIDGADEIDGALRLVKGGGGALTREKLVARASRKLVIVVDEAKQVSRLGEKRRLPVELVAFASRWTLARLAQFDPLLREGFVTDNGGVIADCRIPPDADLPALARELKLVPGVVEHGLFLDEAQVAYIGRADGVTRLTR